MIHPDTELRHVNEKIGYGVYATKFIPKGTVVYVKDKLEIQIKPDDPLLKDPTYAKHIDTYSYIDENGRYILSWDIAKYVNHCCQCNTISTGYGFEIAIRDIQAGEQITDEYGIFNLDKEMTLSCDKPGCRLKITPEDFDRLYPEWDKKITDSLKEFKKVHQPLIPYLEKGTLRNLEHYLKTGKNYRSVYELKYSPQSARVAMI